MSNERDRYREDWRFPQWVQDIPGSWDFVQDGKLVGEVYEIDRGNGFKWHCKTSDWRDINALSVEQAKAECEASFWKEEWQRLRDIAFPSPAPEAVTVRETVRSDNDDKPER